MTRPHREERTLTMARPYIQRQTVNNHEHAEEQSNTKQILKTALLLGLGFYFANVVFTGDLKNYTDWLSRRRRSSRCSA